MKARPNFRVKRLASEGLPAGKRIVVDGETRILTRSEFLEQLSTSRDFALGYSRALLGAGGGAFVWETPAWTRASLRAPNECVVLPSPAHRQLREDARPFSTHFERGGSDAAVAFSSLRGDAILIAPTPNGRAANSAHLGAFLASAPAESIAALWKLAANQLLQEISDEPRWFSTAGLGVSWLHLRIDSRPKYYRHASYRRA